MGDNSEMSTPAEVDEFLRACGQGRIHDVVALLESGVSVSIANRIGYTPLMSASASYRVDVVAELLRRGADSRATTVDGLTALHCAVGSTPSLPKDQAECVLKLIQHGADPDAVNGTGGTPLMDAAWFGCVDAIRVLLRFSVDLERVDNEGRTARDLAIEKGWRKVARLLRS